MEDYIKVHHMWRPLAAMSLSREDVLMPTVSPSGLTDHEQHHHLGTGLARSLTAAITTSSAVVARTAAAVPFADNDSDVWHRIIFSGDSPDSLFSSGNDSVIGEGQEANLMLCNITDGYGNCTSSNGTTAIYGKEVIPWHLITMIGTAVILGILILATVIGNVFVIAAILLERNLQNVANYLILSLAVADLLVACLVMPLSAVYEVSQEWTLGPQLCDMWTSSDLLCCTASILHLVAIALDRYWAVTNIDYIHHRTSKRIGMMIAVVWLVSFLVSIAPLLGWKDPGWDGRLEEKKCIISQDIGFQIFATSSSFYLPLLVILILYWRIFQTARKRIRRRQVTYGTASGAAKNPAAGGIAGGLAAASGTGGIAAAVVTIIGRPLPTISETTTAFTNVSSNNTSPEKTSFPNGLEPEPTTTDCGGGLSYQPQQYYAVKRKKDSADSKRERKAAKTLAIITGAFVICWLPFFTTAVLLPIYKDLFKKYVISTFLWLGYFNSTLNPIIYTIFSPEFRHAFKKILFGRDYAKRRNRALGIRHFQ